MYVCSTVKLIHAPRINAIAARFLACARLVHALCTTPLGTSDRDIAYNFSFVLLLDGTSRFHFRMRGRGEETRALTVAFTAYGWE